MFSSFFKSKKLLANQFFIEHSASAGFKPNKENFISLKQGTIVYSPGDLAEAVYLLINGTVIKRTPQSGFDLAEEVVITEDSYFGKEEVSDSSNRKSLVICDSNCIVYKLITSELLEHFPSVFYGGALSPEAEVISSGSQSFEEELALAEADYESFLKEEQLQPDVFFPPQTDALPEQKNDEELDDLLSFSTPSFFESISESNTPKEPIFSEQDFTKEPSIDDFINQSFEQPTSSVQSFEESSIPPWELEDKLEKITDTKAVVEESHPFDDFFIPSNTASPAETAQQESLLVSGLFYEDLQRHLSDIINRASSLQLRHPLKEEYDELEHIIQDSGNMLSMLELFYFQEGMGNESNLRNDFGTLFSSVERPLQRYALKFDVRLYKKINESGIVELSPAHALKLFLLAIQILINQTVKYKHLYVSTETRFDELTVTIGIHSDKESWTGSSAHTTLRLTPAVRGLLKMLDELCTGLNSQHTIRVTHDTVSALTFSFQLLP